jgi:hypothetical protein
MERIKPTARLKRKHAAFGRDRPACAALLTNKTQDTNTEVVAIH